MIWFVIGIAITIWIIVRGWVNNLWFDTVIGHILANIGQLIVCLICAVIVCIVSSFITTSTVDNFLEQESEQEIFALSDNIGASGDFFLGTGQVGNDLVYFYVIDTENGKHIESVKRENAYIKYGDDHVVTIVSYEFENRLLNWVGFSTRENDYIFTVPDGTITNSFEVDLG